MIAGSFVPSLLLVSSSLSPVPPPGRLLVLPAKPLALTLTPERIVVAMAERLVYVWRLEGLKGGRQGWEEPEQKRESALKGVTRAVEGMKDGLGEFSLFWPPLPILSSVHTEDVPVPHPLDLTMRGLTALSPALSQAGRPVRSTVESRSNTLPRRTKPKSTPTRPTDWRPRRTATPCLPSTRSRTTLLSACSSAPARMGACACGTPRRRSASRAGSLPVEWAFVRLREEGRAGGWLLGGGRLSRMASLLRRATWGVCSSGLDERLALSALTSCSFLRVVNCLENLVHRRRICWKKGLGRSWI